MKKIVSFLLMTTLCFSLTACGSGKANEKTVSETTEKTDAAKSESVGVEKTDKDAENRTLVVYFSATGTTKKIAEDIADGLQADIYEIVPKEPYTDVDLDYNDNDSRSTQEMNDASARPEISGTIENFEQYDTVFLGYPIWWGEAPRILDTFVESYDFTDKTVIPFCTSSSSGIGSTGDTLKRLAGNGNWKEGQRFSGKESAEQVLEWAKQ